jgi:hypothetical protein
VGSLGEVIPTPADLKAGSDLAFEWAGSAAELKHLVKDGILVDFAVRRAHTNDAVIRKITISRSLNGGPRLEITPGK